MTVYFRSSNVVITERLIRVRVPHGWRAWVIAGLSDFGMVCHEPPTDRRSWSLGWSALPLGVVGNRLGGWLLLVAAALLMLACGLFVADRQHARRRASGQLWARRAGVRVLIFDLPNREFNAACRALCRVLGRLEDA